MLMFITIGFCTMKKCCEKNMFQVSILVLFRLVPAMSHFIICNILITLSFAVIHTIRNIQIIIFFVAEFLNPPMKENLAHFRKYVFDEMYYIVKYHCFLVNITEHCFLYAAHIKILINWHKCVNIFF